MLFTDYSDPFLYENGILKCIFTSAGRILTFTNDGSVLYKYEYNLTDHLGNARAVFAEHSNGIPELMQHTDYYPFGMVMNQQETFNLEEVKNRYLYNGKELQDDNIGVKLDWYDYGARFYDPELGRWHSVDPLAEKYYSISPYVYCLNNPINMFDPDGAYAVYHHYNFSYEKMIKLGYSKSTADRVAHYASTYADNPGRFLATSQGNSYRKGIDYSGTSQSQNTASKVSSSWHSMAADGENISSKDAKIRGQQFGWGKIIQAGNEAKNAGGIDNLKDNSKGMQAIGQGLHALQDAQGHEGVNMDNHSLQKDITAPKSVIALSVTESALVITEVLSGNSSNLSQGLTLDVSGIKKSI